MNLEQRISILEKRILRESRDETITDFLRKNHVSQRYIDAIESGYEGIIFDAPLKDFVLGVRSRTYGEEYYGREILIKTIMVIDNNYPSWDPYLTQNKKDVIAFLTAMEILSKHFPKFLRADSKRSIRRNLYAQSFRQ